MVKEGTPPQGTDLSILMTSGSNYVAFRETLNRLAPDGGLEFSGAVFRQVIGPGVYVWLRGNEVQYVGASRTAFARAADRRHHKIQLGKDVADDDAVLFYACRTMAEAFILERELIETLRPRYNHSSLWNRVSIQLGYNSPRSFRRQYLAQPRPDSVLAPPGWYRPRPDPES